MKLCTLIVLLWSTFSGIINAVTIGSDTVPSRQAIANFTSGAGVNNQMLGFASFDKGFTFADTRTTCSYDNFIPVSGSVALCQGRLYLFQDLVFNNDFRLNSPGWILGNNYRVEFPTSVAESLVPSITTTASMFFDSANVSFNTNTTFQCPMQFRKTCTVLGNGHKLTVSKRNPIIVRDGNLTIQDAIIGGLGDGNLRCTFGTGRITLRDCILILERDYTFTQGGITFDGDVIVTGTNKFIYSSTVASTINSQGTLYFDQGTNFSYVPTNARRDLLFMTDVSSVLYLNGCTLSTTRTGIRLSRGTILVDNKVTLTSQAQNSGEAMLFSSDVTVNMLAGAVFDMYGYIKAL